MAFFPKNQLGLRTGVDFGFGRFFCWNWISTSDLRSHPFFKKSIHEIHLAYLSSIIILRSNHQWLDSKGFNDFVPFLFISVVGSIPLRQMPRSRLFPRVTRIADLPNSFFFRNMLSRQMLPLLKTYILENSNFIFVFVKQRFLQSKLKDFSDSSTG